MRCREYLTELEMESSLPRTAWGWLTLALLLAGMYLLRAMIQDIPPEDHLALSLLLCTFLALVWINLEQTVLKFSLPENRCWLRHHRCGMLKERSLPVSQIHSARVEYQSTSGNADTQLARLVLVTSLGMIPVSEHYQENPALMDGACHQINSFLQSQQLYLTA